MSRSLAVLVLVASACAPASTTIPPCTTYGAPSVAGHLAALDLTEASGLAASRVHDGVLYAHNDSGGEPELFALHENGSTAGRFVIGDATAIDWEDLAAGPCPGGGHCLFIGDIGDNGARRASIAIYVVREPDALTATALPLLAKAIVTWEGGPRDCEALLVHPETGDVYLVSKFARPDGPLSRREIGVVRAADLATGAAVAKRFGDLSLGDAPGELVTGADAHPDGTRLVVRTYGAVLEYRGASLEAALAAEPERLPDARRGAGGDELQGESIAYGADGRSVWTTSEGQGAPLNRRSCEAD